MGNSVETPTSHTPADPVAADQDQFGERRGLGVSTITFKVTPQDSAGTFIIENTFHAKGGPARHLHYEQDEWFYAVEGEFLLEVGTEKFRLNPATRSLRPAEFLTCGHIRGAR